MGELVFKKKLGEFYTSPKKLSKENKEVQYLIEINKTPLLLLIGKSKFFYHIKIINHNPEINEYLMIKIREDFDHTDIKSMKKYSDLIFNELKEQSKNKIINGYL